MGSIGKEALSQGNKYLLMNFNNQAVLHMKNSYVS